MPDPVLAKLARELAPPERMKLKEFCALCKISINTLRYLKQLGYVSPPGGKGGGAYYTLAHVRQVETAQRLKGEIGTFSKIAKYNRTRTRNADADESGYVVQHVLTLSTGIMIVVPEVLGEAGKAQLRRLIAAGKDSGTKRLAALAESVLSSMEISDRMKARPKARGKPKQANPLPSADQ